MRVLFFLFVLVAVPEYVDANIPFPGINYLFELDFVKVCSITILLPVLLSGAHSEGRQASSFMLDAAVIAFVGLTSILSIRDLPLTSALRFSFDQILLFLLPYLVIRKTVFDERQLASLFHLLVTVAVILATIGIVAELKRWNFYGLLDTGVPFYTHGDFRSGILRVSATMNPTTLGYMLILGLLSLEYLRTSSRMSLMRLWGLRLLFLTVLFFTQSRGAWLAGALAVGTYAAMTFRIRGLGWLIGLLVSGAATVIAVLLWTGGMNDLDPYGTFSYRVELFGAAFMQIPHAPLFGSVAYLESGRFDHLIQGQGIIDVVSVYLQIVLEYGIVGLLIFLSAFALALRELLRVRPLERNKKRYWPNGELNKATVVVIAAIVAYLALIGTISNVSFVPHIGFLLLGIACSITRSVRVLDQKQEKQNGVLTADATVSSDKGFA